MPNRLAEATSPYLLQHAENPVDWYPWGEEAFARAEAEDKPIFLSVGYSSCHWCHVMAHESFEDEDVARVLNEHFVSIKLDREERPDVDEAFMTAVQLTSGRGGWPMSVFMTPDRRPFFAGTYFPKQDRGGHPGFLTVCTQLAQAWATRRADIEDAANQISTAVSENLGRTLPATKSRFDQAFLDQSVRTLLSDFDPENGGFGRSPKFPPHTSLEFLIRYATQTTGPVELREAALTASFLTLQKMCLGGIQDHVGGGFHRYSTDERWLLPHFEKMLYDNALMLGNLARASVVAEGFDPALSDRYRQAANGIIEWIAREMTSPDGLFYSALDADSEGEEGRFYVWTDEEIKTHLGDRAEAFLRAYRFAPEGNFRDEATQELTGANIPHLADEPDEDFSQELAILREARETRIRPSLDDKALVSWNALALAAFAEVGLMDMAVPAAEAILAAETAHGTLPHQIAKGRPTGRAFLDGYAFFADALLRLAIVAEAFEEEGEPLDLPRTPADYRAQAIRLAQEMIARFYDEEHGGFYGSSADHETLFGRTKPVFDQPIPSGNAVALRVLLEIGDETRARQTLAYLLPWMERVPHATEAIFDAALPLVEDSPVSAPVASPAKPAEVEVSVSKRELVADANGIGHAEVLIRIPEGLHLNSNEPPARWLTPTRLQIRPLSATVAYPPASNDRYVGDLRIPFEVKLPAGESGAEFELLVAYQACTESECLLPQERTYGMVVVRG